ncbi:MAG: hypothetical protein M3Q40_10245 [Pseudomonadota bacterium]|nr:hypothetical protein [Pseudomonadota bacterium]
MNAEFDERRRRRNRMLLLGIFAIFFGSMLLAGLLRFSGWRPEGMKNVGELLQPPGDLRDVAPVLTDGREYEWSPAERTWRIVVAPPVNCTTECERVARDVHVVWQLFGKDADRVHVLWVGTPPAGPRPDTLQVVRPTPALRAGLPRADDPAGVPVYVVDPNGFVVLRYPPGADLAGVRTDLARLLKLR